MPETISPTNRQAGQSNSPASLSVRESGNQDRLDFSAVRQRTHDIGRLISDEALTVQSMTAASPGKWHLAHTSWFFDQFILQPIGRGIADENLQTLFNSYYHGAGPRHDRSRRGMIIRPTVDEVYAYRGAVDEAMAALIGEGCSTEQAELIELGCHHEQQHQELMLTDIKHVFAEQLVPVALSAQTPSVSPASAGDGVTSWSRHPGGQVSIGVAGQTDNDQDASQFYYDNEGPRHDVLLQPFAVANQLVRAGEWLAFINDGGYQQPLLWLDDGWHAVQEIDWSAPLYWRQGNDGDWQEYTLHGWRSIDLQAPVTHVSYFEAQAFATWAGARLPTEAEWETVAPDPQANAAAMASTSSLAAAVLHPGDAANGWYGQVWQWTQSAYLPYPRYQPNPGVVGEYNGKFMNGCYVLRGSSVATSPLHARLTYRNFFGPTARWQFSGVRLAKDE